MYYPLSVTVSAYRAQSTDRHGNFEVKKEVRCKTTNDDADGCCEILGDIVGIINNEGYNDTSRRLEQDCSPDYPVVSSKEAGFCNLLAVHPENTKED